MRTLVAALLIVVAGALALSGLTGCSATSASNPVRKIAFPLEAMPTWEYTVRVWALDHNPVTNPAAPRGWHELTAAEIMARGESPTQTVTVLRYDPPNRYGSTVWGLFCAELKSVQWVTRVPATGNNLGKIVQIAETGPGGYDPTLTPAQNDAAGKIAWFQSGPTWYPRTWLWDTSWSGQTWSESWGPVSGGAVEQRTGTSSDVAVGVGSRTYRGVVSTIRGPSETYPNTTLTEALTFGDGVGLSEHYLDLTTTTTAGPPFGANTMFLRRIIRLQSFSVPPIG